MSPIGYSPTGEVFNLSAADVARSAAIALGADKLIFLLENPGVTDADGHSSPTSSAATSTPFEADPLPEDLAQSLRAGAEACRSGIKSVHLIGRRDDGALLRELFTRDGIGTLISASPLRTCARPDRRRDGHPRAAAALEQGVLVRRSRERLETEIDRFHLTEGRHGDRLRRPLLLSG